MKELSCPSRRGRPRAFVECAALAAALRVFWAKGYEGTSLADLTAAMKINRPSLYAAFGNKEALFRKVLGLYRAGAAGQMECALREPTARCVAQAYLAGMVMGLSNPRQPRGCLLVHGALACGESGKAIQRELISSRRANTAALRRRFARAKAEGDLPPDSDPGDLARYLSTVGHGLSIQAMNGATRAELERIATIALQAWPAESRRV